MSNGITERDDKYVTFWIADVVQGPDSQSSTTTTLTITKQSPLQ